MITSSIESGQMPERRTASFIAIAPSCGAVKLARLLRNLPVGVRAAPTITGVFSDDIRVCSFRGKIMKFNKLMRDIVNATVGR